MRFCHILWSPMFFKMILFYTDICWLPFPWRIEEGGSGALLPILLTNRPRISLLDKTSFILTAAVRQ